MELKACTKCKEEKPFDLFPNWARSKDGKSHWCKVCRKNYYSTNKVAILEKTKAYSQKNTNRIRKTKAEWRKANPEKRASQQRRRKARTRGNEASHYTMQDVLNTYGTACHICNIEVDLTAPRRAGHKGWELGLQLDHVIPLSKGGADSLPNVKPAHGKCNLAKASRLNS